MLALKGYDYHFVNKLSINGLKRLLESINKNKTEEVRFRLWLGMLPSMTMSGNFISFSDFLDMNERDERSKEEILNELDSIEQKFKERDV